MPSFLTFVIPLLCSTSVGWGLSLPHRMGVSRTANRVRRHAATLTAPNLDHHDDWLSDVPLGPPDAILGLGEAFKKCTAPDKVNLVIGAYRDVEGNPYVLPSVRAAEAAMLEGGVNKEYAPIAGDPQFVERALAFAFGQDSEPLAEGRVAGVQALSGTGSLRIGGEFYASFLGAGTPLYCSAPTWGNHVGIMNKAGLDVRRYRYFDETTKGLNFDGMVADIAAAPEGSIFLLHACAHNPTGVDPTREQWAAIRSALEAGKHHVFFDSAYQGFASGDADADAWVMRTFAAAADSFGSVCLAQSFAKNFGLYGERVGTFSLVCRDAEERERVMSQLKLIIRPMYSSPPIHGAGIVKTVLSDDVLSAQYYGECADMAARIADMRQLLRGELEAAGSALDWSHVTQQIGMFCFTGMTAVMVEELTEKHNIFLTKDGRISIAGINPGNVKKIAAAMHDVTSRLGS
jgi:aspartate aminotransferase